MKLVSLPLGWADLHARFWLPLLEKGAEEAGDEKLPEYLEQIASGVMWLHLIMTDDLREAKAVVGTRAYRRGTTNDMGPPVQVGEIAVCAGTDMAEWIDLLPELEATLRRDVGAEQVVLDKARPGWRRALARYGYRTVACDFERTL